MSEPRRTPLPLVTSIALMLNSGGEPNESTFEVARDAVGIAQRRLLNALRPEAPAHVLDAIEETFGPLDGEQLRANGLEDPS